MVSIKRAANESGQQETAGMQLRLREVKGGAGAGAAQALGPRSERQCWGGGVSLGMPPGVWEMDRTSQPGSKTAASFLETPSRGPGKRCHP